MSAPRFEAGQRVRVRPAWRMGPTVGGPGTFAPDGCEGDWWVVEVGTDGDLGLARHVDAWGPEFWVTAARAKALDGRPYRLDESPEDSQGGTQVPPAAGR